MKHIHQLRCDCEERVGVEINSMALFEELKEFFSRQVGLGIFQDIPVKKPFYRRSYADKWYLCRVCGCLWEFIYPDFPAKGKVRKFSDGTYFDEDEELTRKLIAKGQLCPPKKMIRRFFYEISQRAVPAL